MEQSQFELRPAQPYSLSQTVARLVRFTTLVDRVNPAGEYSRCLHLDGNLALMRVAQSGPSSRPVLHVRLSGEKVLGRGVREVATSVLHRALGVGCDLGPFYRAFRDDPLLSASIRAHRGMAPCGGATLFESMLTAVLAQQVNLKFAYSIYDALTRRYGEHLVVEGETRIAFPTPDRLSRVRESTLRQLKLSSAKASTILRVSKAFANGELDEATLAELPDEDVIERLVAYKGIGRWTAETSLIRGLGRLDVFPAGDLGVVKKIAIEMLGRRESASEAEMRDFSERWRPYRSLALIYAYAALYGESSATRGLPEARNGRGFIRVD